MSGGGPASGGGGQARPTMARVEVEAIALGRVLTVAEAQTLARDWLWLHAELAKANTPVHGAGSQDWK